jgi:hypothetical protein
MGNEAQAIYATGISCVAARPIEVQANIHSIFGNTTVHDGRWSCRVDQVAGQPLWHAACTAPVGRMLRFSLAGP